MTPPTQSHRRHPALARLAILAGPLLTATALAQTGFITSVAPYTVPVGPDYTIIPLLSSGDVVPRTDSPGKEYQMVGIPDGLGAYGNSDGTITLLMNHEMREVNTHQPRLLDPLDRGAIVSKYILTREGRVLSGDRAYHAVYLENVLYGPPAEVGNTTPAFSRLCSGSMSWEQAGFDRPIYFCGEESGGLSTFDRRGGLLWATFDQAIHSLPKAGHLSWENALVRPDPAPQTVIMCMEDGELGNCQLYMYVGTKDRSPGASALRRNGLDNGSLYVFVSNARRRNSEFNVRDGQVQGKWVLVVGAEGMNDVELELASDNLGAFAFDRIEDGAFRPGRPNEFYFDTTGGGAANSLGRLYRLDLNADNVLGPAKITMIYNADEIFAAGGDVAVSPDNVDCSDRYVMIQEDGTAQSRVAMAARDRQGGIWRLDLQTGDIEYIAELTGLGRDGTQTGPGVWETSGIIDASAWFGPDAWLFDVQAHAPTPAPAPNTVEDGQLLLMLRNL